MDKTKRQTLKRMATAVAAASLSAATANSMALENSGDNPTTANGSIQSADPSLSDIKLHTRISSVSNDLEVVITNVGEQTTTITQLTPSQTTTERGVFHFSELMNNGPLVLESGKSVSVAMTPHPVSVSTTRAHGTNGQTLTSALRSSFSVITDGQAFAKVNVVNGMQLV